MTAGSGWEVIEGLDSGQTQVDHPGDADMAVWAHPIDVHLVCKVRECACPRHPTHAKPPCPKPYPGRNGAHSLTQGLTGWPRLFFEVWELDDGGRTDICGYG